jgi:alpha-galactosidase
MTRGLEMPYRNDVEWNKKNDWSSRVLLLEAE